MKTYKNGFKSGKSKRSSKTFLLVFHVSSSCKQKKDDQNEKHAIDSETEPNNWLITGMFQVLLEYFK